MRKQLFPSSWARWMNRGVNQSALWETFKLPSIRLMALGHHLGIWTIKSPGLADFIVSKEVGGLPEWKIRGTKLGRRLVLEMGS